MFYGSIITVAEPAYLPVYKRAPNEPGDTWWKKATWLPDPDYEGIPGCMHTDCASNHYPGGYKATPVRFSTKPATQVWYYHSSHEQLCGLLTLCTKHGGVYKTQGKKGTHGYRSFYLLATQPERLSTEGGVRDTISESRSGVLYEQKVAKQQRDEYVQAHRAERLREVSLRPATQQAEWTIRTDVDDYGVRRVTVEAQRSMYPQDAIAYAERLLAVARLARDAMLADWKQAMDEKHEKVAI